MFSSDGRAKPNELTERVDGLLKLPVGVSIVVVPSASAGLEPST